MDDASGDVEFLRHQTVGAEPRVVNAPTCRFIAIEAGEARCRRVLVHKLRRQVDKAIITETTEALQEGKIDRSHFAISTDAKVVGARPQVRQQQEFVSTNMIVAESRPAVSLRRVTDVESDRFVLWQDREIEIS